jgi:hypothetical protein
MKRSFFDYCLYYHHVFNAPIEYMVVLPLVFPDLFLLLQKSQNLLLPNNNTAFLALGYLALNTKPQSV